MIGRVDEHAGDRGGALGLVQDADLEVDELDRVQLGDPAGQRRAQSAVHRVDRTVALGCRDDALTVVEELDRGLGLDPPVGAFFGDDPEALQHEERLVCADLALKHQLKRSVRHFEMVAVALQVLDALEDVLDLLVIDFDAELVRLRQDGAATRQLADGHVALVADQDRIEVLICGGVVQDRRRVHAALVGERVVADVGRPLIRRQVGHLGDVVAERRDLADLSGVEHLVPHLEGE